MFSRITQYVDLIFHSDMYVEGQVGGKRSSPVRIEMSKYE